MPDYSDGPFSYVVFFLTRDFKWTTYTYRRNRVAPSRSLVNTLVTISDSHNSFNDIYVETSLLNH